MFQRKSSNLPPEPQINPFEWDEAAHSGPCQFIKMVLIGLVLFVPRVLLIFILLFIGWLNALLIIACYKFDHILMYPIQRLPLRRLMSGLARSYLFVWGFYWIKTTGKAPTWGHFPAAIIVSNHMNFMDPVLFLSFFGYMAVGKMGALQAPIVGTIAQAMQCIPVEREAPESRKKVANEIKRRALWKDSEEYEEYGPWTPLLIFPEATCTNAKCIIQFKPGAFMPGVPVQPVTFRYTYRHLDLAWVGPSNALAMMARMLCQFSNSVEVNFLPVYEPNEAEKKDAVLFSQGVRAKMAESLGVPMTEHNYDDLLLYNETEKLRLPQLPYNVEFGKLKHIGGIAKAKEMLTKFAEIDKDNDGYLDKEEFGEFMALNDNIELRDAIFAQWDSNQDGKINFREFLICTASQAARRSSQIIRRAEEQHQRTKSEEASEHEMLPVGYQAEPPPAAAATETTIVLVDDTPAHPPTAEGELSPPTSDGTASCGMVSVPQLHTPEESTESSSTAAHLGLPLERRRTLAEIDSEKEELLYSLTLCFGAFDVTHEQFVSRGAFYEGMKIISPTIPDEVIDNLFDEVDADGDGMLSLDEFIDYSVKHEAFMRYVLKVLNQHRQSAN